jgi:UPF0716 family protein affecting phage T7 exclusion
MIETVALFLTTGVALVVAVTAAIGLAWLAVAIPVLISAAAGYGLFALSRRWNGRRTSAERLPERLPERLNGRRGED